MNDQQHLVNAIFNRSSNSSQQSDSESFGFEEEGLEIYRRNLKTSAVRALQISYPTVLKLVGDELFAYAVERLLKIDPPSSGDWGLWGDTFPELLETLTALNEFPYVIDIARIDFFMHIQGREKDCLLYTINVADE